MKNLLRFFQVLTCVCYFTILQSQPTTLKTFVEGSGTICICNTMKTVSIELTSPTQIPSSEFKEFIFNNYPSMSFRVEIDNYVQVADVNQIMYSHFDDATQLHIYDASAKLDVPPCEFYDEDIDNDLFISLDLIHVDRTRAVFDPYPVCDYVSFKDIFSCLYYDQAVPGCDPSKCYAYKIYHNEETIDVNCNDYGTEFTKALDVNTNSQSNEFGSVIIYPNPTQDELHIETQYNVNYDLVLYNSNGKEVIPINQSFNRLEGDVQKLDISSLPNGVYIVQISNGQDKVIKRVYKY